MLKTLVVLGAFATGLVTLWLFAIVVLVLPGRDPAHVGQWAALACGFALYAASTLWLVRRAHPAWLPASVSVASIGAIGLGVYLFRQEWTAASGHFEGYLLVLGLVLAAHGMSALAYIGRGALHAARARTTA